MKKRTKVMGQEVGRISGKLGKFCTFYYEMLKNYELRMALQSYGMLGKVLN